MTVYADTSFFASLYLKDAHSAAASRWLRGGAYPSITLLHIAEWNHAIAQHLFRGQLSVAEADRLRRDFDNDCAARIWQHLSVPETALELCSRLGQQYGPKFGSRTLDSLHVACALELKTRRFWTFDDRQKKLATAVGLDTR